MSRQTCYHCFRIQSLCLCEAIESFEVEPKIVLLVHPREFMKTVGTARIVKLSIKDSILIRGCGADFDHDPKIHALVSDPKLHCMVLFPGVDSLNLNSADSTQLAENIPVRKKLVVFVIDGTWSIAKNMILQSTILSSLPKLSFNVVASSVYQFRKQPKEFCLSTVEAVALLIENLKVRGLCSPKPVGGHQKMIRGFHELIKAQLTFEANPNHRDGKRFRKKPGSEQSSC